ncbi:hypothetical protein SAMN05414137_104149 [Streptacidiphilus jiangxiensis]|uniref:Uncharacterized protein n=1 Tax=Streptacidiphilus jiangxiensis TaxID=235985 RepID=A0A1H7KQF4_STRJI|nr:hypothetical protein SAMN05414137_104149 [Streptacidiphilus jiangxiensis]
MTVHPTAGRSDAVSATACKHPPCPPTCKHPPCPPEECKHPGWTCAPAPGDRDD